MTPQEQEQRIAELERELDKALQERREWMEKVTVARQRIAELQGQGLGLTDLKELEYLMEVAAAHLTVRSPFNDSWKKRAKAYQLIFKRRIKETEESTAHG